jgi:glucose/arabinose dehydrogenase
MAGMHRSVVAVVVPLAALLACTGPVPTPTATPPTGSPTVTQPPTASASLAPAPSPATASPAATATATSTATPISSIGLVPFAEGLRPLVLLSHAGDGSGRVYAVEQEGFVRVGDADGTFETEPFLDIEARVGYGGEQGLLGLAFHPDYATNGRLFVDYSDGQGDNVIAEFARNVSGDGANPDSERVLLTIEQPFANHNGGMLAFGPDGYLYVSSGDGGNAGDPLGSGQDLGSRLGKILRIDVDTANGPYGIPEGNPFAGVNGALPEIWSYGLRNPWRLSFDRTTGDMFVGDVGQGSYEEVNAEPAGVGGRNYGWNEMEGPVCFGGPDCDRTDLTLPAATYGHRDANCSITGGYVYRGTSEPGLVGTYLFADYCSGTVWGIDAAAAVAGGPLEPIVLADSGINVTGFGEDEAGEVYLVGAGGEILRVTAP